ncbi:B12-binding domain-containing radical SAM protein [Tistlia consotensis]|uniref:B12-binding domain-containing radical SAM protein n=1 Tax=Tistlia consotensis TaxID=1321365 RepID=UPI00190EBFC0|nr:radical SAM protein [Tistlia consotensis]
MSRRGRLGLLLIKPSHYDDDGYVIQWRSAFIVANSLAVVDGIIADAAQRLVLGPDVQVESRRIDEVCEILQPAKLMRWLDGFDRSAVLMTGVQSSQFPRALDVAKQFTAAGYQVVVGGFHVSGSLAMVPDWTPAFEGVAEAGVSLYAGELEPGIDELLRDIFDGTLKPLYNYLGSTTDLATAPNQVLMHDLAARTVEGYYGVEVGRGCPFVCSFCTIINFHGRTLRPRTPEAIERYLRQWADAGGKTILVTDDNFARSPIWREVLEIFARLRREDPRRRWDIWIQVDALATRISGFVEACRRAGVTRLFVGLESVRADNLAAAAKGQNKVHQLRDMIVTWKRAGIMVYAGYIVGLPNDTPARLAEEIRELQEVYPIDFLTVFLLTPLPGSEDHKKLVAAGTAMDLDLNRYDSTHVTTAHPLMTRQEVQDLYWRCWSDYFSLRHLKTVLGRALYHGLPMDIVRSTFVCTRTIAMLERMHTGDSGALRIKDRRSRRAGYPVEPMVPHFCRRFASNTWIVALTGVWLAYAYLVELALRLEKRRNGLAHYACELTPVEETRRARAGEASTVAAE